MAIKHLHKYRLKNLTRDPAKAPYNVYVCIKQDCTHHIRVELVEGKMAECNRCGEPFVMKLSKLKHGDRIITRPHCEDCTKTPAGVKEKKKKVENSIDELVASILPKGM